MKYLINTITSWQEPPRARHQVAQALAKNNEVIFVARNEIGMPKLEIYRTNEYLTVITPYYPIDYRIRFRLPLFNEIYQNWLFKGLAKHVGSQTQVRVINFDFTATQIYRYFSDVIYYCNDDPLKFPANTIFLPYLYTCERLLMRRSRFIVVVSDYLMRAKASKKTHLIYLGADEFYFMDDQPGGRNKKVLNYMGGINNRKLEISWIRMIADEFPDWQIDLLGPVSNSIRRELSGMANIKIYGVKRGQELVDILSKCSVGIIPFKNNRIMRTCSANNKYWQYLALGKPVVYRKLPYLLKVPEYLMFKATKYTEFKNKILQAIESDDKNLQLKRIEFARLNTWTKRVDELIRLYDLYENNG